jgi:hypothetical protein
LTLEAKRQLVEKLRFEFGIELLCEILEMNRSSFYYDAVVAVDDGVRAAIVRIAEEFPAYGYRMITKELKRREFVVNAKRVRRLMHEENLVISVRRFVTTSEYRRDTRDWPNLLKMKRLTKLNG